MVRELSKRETGRTVYILDEPTTGLHFADIQRLLTVIHRLTDKGNTVIVIEHNLEVIKSADYSIDLGPEGGEKGGEVVAWGTPEQLVQNSASYTGQFLKKKIGVMAHLNGVEATWVALKAPLRGTLPTGSTHKV